MTVLRLRFLNGSLQGQAFDVSGEIAIGRAPSNSLVVPDLELSSAHGRIRFEEERVIFEDLDSTNGSQLNGQPVRTAELHHGDRLALAETEVAVEILPAETIAVPEVPPYPLPVQPGEAAAVAAATPAPGVEHQEAGKAAVTEPDGHPRAIPNQSGPSEEGRGELVSHARGGTRIMEKSRIRAEDTGAAEDCNANSGNNPRKQKKRAGLSWSAAAIALALAGLWLVRGCGVEPNMVSAKAERAAQRQMKGEGVELRIREPVGLARRSEPVTSGVPLPEGVVGDLGKLSLWGKDRKPLPCQFTPLCRWPDGSLKWVLLDFQADLSPSNTEIVVLRRKPGEVSPPQPVKVTLTANGVELGNGGLKLGIDTNVAGLISWISLNGTNVVTDGNPVQAVLTDGSNQVYRASRPDKLVVESQGPMRATVLVQGHFVADDGTTIHGGKVGYDLRIHAYAAKTDLKCDFTLKNNGWYGYRNEGKRHPRQWLYIRSLRLDLPLDLAGAQGAQAELGGKALQLNPGEGVTLTQWYKYPYGESRGYRDIARPAIPPWEKAAGMTNKLSGFFWAYTTNSVLAGAEGMVEGSARLAPENGLGVTVAVRRFVQNFPAGFSVALPGRISFVPFPEGGCWPRTLNAYEAATYQFEGGRQKTWALTVRFGAKAAEGHDLVVALDSPLMAVAATEWYRDTGAVLPLAPGGLTFADKDVAEAVERYDRLQRAKVRVEFGDPAGPEPIVNEDRWGRLSIPSLWARCPDVFWGAMNHGDLVWPYGYCSLFYDWPYQMTLQYLRLGDREFLDVGSDMARHRYDIDQYHVENTEPHLGGFQRYEKGHHGNLQRDEFSHRTEKNTHASHTWNRGLLLYWALTGDDRSLEAARETGRAYHRLFFGQYKLGEKSKLPLDEFRVPAWAMENWLALYEYTGEKPYLDWANEVFNKTVLAMERDNGNCGHIVKDGKQGAQFVAYLVEPVCRLHHLTGRKDALEFLERVLDWQRKAQTTLGVKKDGVYHPLLWKEDPDYSPDPGERVTIGAGNSYSFPLADGYAYLYHVLGRAEDLEFSRQIFKEAIFYLAIAEVRTGTERTPLGYHHLGTPFESAAKVHAYSGRYGSLYLFTEEQQNIR